MRWRGTTRPDATLFMLYSFSFICCTLQIPTQAQGAGRFLFGRWAAHLQRRLEGVEWQEVDLIDLDGSAVPCVNNYYKLRERSNRGINSGDQTKIHSPVHWANCLESVPHG